MSVALIEATDEYFAHILAGTAPAPLRLADGGIESREVLAMLRGLAASIGARFQPAAWLVVHEDEFVGLCSVVKPPRDGTVEIGYGIAPLRRGQGLATMAIAALVDWATRDDGVNALAADTSVANIASQRVLEHNGFARTGARLDPEDGPMIGWRRDTRR